MQLCDGRAIENYVVKYSFEDNLDGRLRDLDADLFDVPIRLLDDVDLSFDEVSLLLASIHFGSRSPVGLEAIILPESRTLKNLFELFADPLYCPSRWLAQFISHSYGR